MLRVVYESWIGNRFYIAGGIITSFDEKYATVYGSDFRSDDDSNMPDIYIPVEGLEKAFIEIEQKYQDIYNAENTKSFSDSALDFVGGMWTDQNWYATPEKIDYEVAVLDLEEYRKDEIEIPEDVTPAVYMRIWNELCAG